MSERIEHDQAGGSEPGDPHSQELTRSRQRASEFKSRYDTLRLEVERLAAELESIKASQPYAAGLALWRLRKRVFPDGSLRQRGLMGLLGLLSGRRALPSVPAAAEASAPPAALPGGPSGHAVHIVTERFLDMHGNNIFSGGAERYLIELAGLIQRLGYPVVVYQSARGHWVRYYKTLRVVGLDCAGEHWRMSEVYHREAVPALLTIYHLFLLAEQGAHRPAIGISHGVFWDQPIYQTDAETRQRAVDALLRAIGRLDQFVSVDTNTINWLRTQDLRLAARACYLPNFVDLEAFSPMPSRRERPGRIVVLYPRRLYAPRGFWLVREIIDALLAAHPQVDFDFVGKADAAEEQAIGQLCEQYPDRVRWSVLPPERMAEAYRQADIAIIPTLHSEGTSLSCLEALACGNAVIATDVGGLPDLILPEWNGLLIEPAACALKDALQRLIIDGALREELGRNARRSVRGFTLAAWRKRWEAILVRHLAVRRARSGSRPVAVFPQCEGSLWSGPKTRRHRLARLFAAAGVETFWINAGPREVSGSPLLHVLAQDDDMLAEGAIVVKAAGQTASPTEEDPRARVWLDWPDGRMQPEAGGEGIVLPDAALMATEPLRQAPCRAMLAAVLRDWRAATRSATANL